MWLLENDGEVFEGRKLWLRPGKRYLLGRTSNGAGSFTIPDKTISRKHLTIEVAAIPEGKSADPKSRSTITIEDLETKLGTWVNGKNIKAEKLDLTKDENELKVANYSKLFRITWRPVVFSFSFTKAELQQPRVWAMIQQNLEPLDIKYTAEYESEYTTHVVMKKLGNTSKVLQALVDGKPFVSEAFVNAVVSAAKPHPGENGAETSELEEDFEAAWPKAKRHLPPRADGPGADRSAKTFSPDRKRREIFEGYTFIFYERKRFDDLFPVIASGKGKALLKEAIPDKTEIDDFIRYVKSIAGEKGLGEFEDGSEGRGVVVVRYVPSTGGPTDEWYLNFYNQVALRLDHRPIETRDFLPAILDNEPAQLRRALEVEPTPREPATQAQGSQANNANGAGNEEAMEIDEVQAPPSPIKESPPPIPRRGRQRRAPQSRFKGFDHGSDDDDETQKDPVQKPEAVTSQAPALGELSRSQRKRPAPERDVMDEVAPTAAAIKRMRLETGEDPLPAAPPSPPPPAQVEPPKSPRPQKGKGKNATAAAAAPAKNTKRKKGALISDDDYLNQFLQEGQEEEAQLRAERELIQRQLAEGTIDFEDIRQGTAVQTVEVRIPPTRPAAAATVTQGASRRQPGDGQQDERWDPRWNGLRNFKKFGRQGRQQPRNIIPLEPVQKKDYKMVRSDYLRERRRKRDANQTSQASINSNPARNSASARDESMVSDSEENKGDAGDDDNDDGDKVDGTEISSLADVIDLEAAAEITTTAAPPSRSRKGKAAQKANQTAVAATRGTTTSQNKKNKRAAKEPPAGAKSRPAKRQATTRSTRAVRSRTNVESSDDEDDEEDDEDGERAGGDDSEGEGTNFRFGTRK